MHALLFLTDGAACLRLLAPFFPFLTKTTKYLVAWDLDRQRPIHFGV